MRILLDGRPLQGATGKRGVGRYVRDLALGLLQAPGGHEVDLLYNPRREALVDPPRHTRSACVPARAPAGPAMAWGRLLGPSWIAAAGADAWHATFLAPPRVPRKQPWVATIHDLIPLRHPQMFNARQLQVFRRSLALSAKAPGVIAVSRFTADLIAQQLGVPAGRVHVVPPPVELAAFVSPPFKGVRGISQPYLLHLGGFDPLKGVADLLLPAFASVAAQDKELLLVLSGGAGEARTVAERAAQELGLAQRTVFAGYLPSPAHEAAVAGARAVVVSSREEGFGIPAVEALAAGVPLAVGPSEATREIAPDLACHARDDSPASLAAAMMAALEQGSSSRAERQAAAAPYDRQEVARQMLAIYREVGAG